MKKELKKVRVECANLVVGMYVCELDRSWLDSPFLLQGFYVADNHDIDTVRNICDYVFIDKMIERDQITSNLPTASSAVLMTTNVIRTAELAVGKLLVI